MFDPLTLAGQRATGSIPLFRDSLGLEQILIVAPVPALTEFPLQTFYQSVLSPGEAGARAGGAGAAVFLSLPRQQTLTVRIDSPEAWNIQAATAIQVQTATTISTQCYIDISLLFSMIMIHVVRYIA